MPDETTKTPRQYIVNLNRAGYPRLTNIAGVMHPPVLKKVGTIHFDGIGDIPKMRSTGRYDANTFEVQFTDSFGAVAMPKDRDAIHKKVRKLREQERGLIDAIDEQIKVLRSQRDELLRLAWQNGNVVTIKELEGLVK